MSKPAQKTTDLGIRTLSAIVMLAIAGTALWLGGVWLDAFLVLVGVACFGELVRLILKADFSTTAKAVGIVLGLFYIGLATAALMAMELFILVAVVLLVILVDVSAYGFGRAFGKRKIAPSISPSKSWAGLFGAMAMCALAMALIAAWLSAMASAFGNGSGDAAPMAVIVAAVAGAGIAILAQAGDFFESWLKRRAGMKDSSNLIPGHGGIFDRTDGLIPVAILAGAYLHWFPV